jgi:hypothetical protein
VKFVLEMSKKTFAYASTLIRAVLVGVFGSTTTSEPSFGVAAANTVGKLAPPLVDSRMLTEPAKALEPLTVQVTV